MGDLTDYQTLVIILLALILMAQLIANLVLIRQTFFNEREENAEQLVQKLEINDGDVLLLRGGTISEAARLKKFIQYTVRKDVNVAALREGQSLIKAEKKKED